MQHADEQQSSVRLPMGALKLMWEMWHVGETNSSVTHDLHRLMQLNRPVLHHQFFRGEIIIDE